MRSFDDMVEEFLFLDDRDDRWGMIIDLGRELEPMPDALKTDMTKVRGCSAQVWVYPTAREDKTLHFLADSDAGITKGVIALVLATVQDRPAAEIRDTDIAEKLAPFDLKNHLTSNRTQGIPNMIALIRATAERYA